MTDAARLSLEALLQARELQSCWLSASGDDSGRPSDPLSRNACSAVSFTPAVSLPATRAAQQGRYAASGSEPAGHDATNPRDTGRGAGQRRAAAAAAQPPPALRSPAPPARAAGLAAAAAPAGAEPAGAVNEQAAAKRARTSAAVDCSDVRIDPVTGEEIWEGLEGPPPATAQAAPAPVPQHQQQQGTSAGGVLPVPGGANHGGGTTRPSGGSRPPAGKAAPSGKGQRNITAFFGSNKR